MCGSPARPLQYQAQIAEQMQRHAVARNFRRAAGSLSPFLTSAFWLSITRCARSRSSQAELLAIADELEHTWHATVNAAFVRESAGSVSAAA
ncbi:diol dehydratase small subunit [Klebsiella pneumoniae]